MNGGRTGREVCLEKTLPGAFRPKLLLTGGIARRDVTQDICNALKRSPLITTGWNDSCTTVYKPLPARLSAALEEHGLRGRPHPLHAYQRLLSSLPDGDAPGRSPRKRLLPLPVVWTGSILPAHPGRAGEKPGVWRRRRCIGPLPTTDSELRRHPTNHRRTAHHKRSTPMTLLKRMARRYKKLGQDLALSMAQSHHARVDGHCRRCEARTLWIARPLSGHVRCLRCGHSPFDGARPRGEDAPRGKNAHRNENTRHGAGRAPRSGSDDARATICLTAGSAIEWGSRRS